MIFLLIILNNLSAFAGNSYTVFGLGVNTPSQNKITDVKMIGVGYQDELLLLDHKAEMGAWFDSSGINDRKSSVYASYEIGLQPKFRIFYIHWFSGVGLITDRDQLLGSNFQFMHDFGIGILDKRGLGIGLYYKHISNAGIVQPNYGRDFIGMRLTLPW